MPLTAVFLALFSHRSVNLCGCFNRSRGAQLMSDASAHSFSSTLRSLTTELRTLDHDLKSSRQVDAAALREFRQALDNVRMTAWTVSELLNVREARRNPQAVISFMA